MGTSGTCRWCDVRLEWRRSGSAHGECRSGQVGLLPAFEDVLADEFLEQHRRLGVDDLLGADQQSFGGPGQLCRESADAIDLGIAVFVGAVDMDQTHVQDQGWQQADWVAGEWIGDNFRGASIRSGATRTISGHCGISFNNATNLHVVLRPRTWNRPGIVNT